MQQAQDRRRNQLPEQSNDHGGVHGFFHRLFFSLTDCMRNHYIAAQRNADKQVDDQPDEGAVCADGCNGYRAVLLRKIADNRKIGSVEQLLQNCRRRDRYRKLRQSFP